MIHNLHADAVVSTCQGISLLRPFSPRLVERPEGFCAMSSDGLVARVGREKQRYEDHFRLVSGCIPYKLVEPVEDGAGGSLSGLRVLMISTPNRHDLVFPKGGWENDETDEEAACREAMEEAGIRGIVRGALGIWEFRSKSKQDSCSLKGLCKGTMFALEVTEELSSWPEQESYKRDWLTVSEAWERCRYDWMREALNKFLVFLSGESEQSSSSGIPDPSISAKLMDVLRGWFSLGLLVTQGADMFVGHRAPRLPDPVVLLEEIRTEGINCVSSSEFISAELQHSCVREI